MRPVEILYDKHSLFYDRRGNRLLNYTTLAGSGEKIAPTIIFPVPERRPRGRPRTRPAVSEARKRPRGRPRKQSATPLPVAQMTPRNSPLAPTPVQVAAGENEPKTFIEIPGCCDNPLTKDSFGIQQPDLYGAKRGVALWRGREGRVAKPQALQRKAFALQARLAGCHWDNYKVRFSRRTAHSYAFRALCDGHEEWRIMACYERALFVCHGHAVDRAASSGKIVLFNPSSTIVKAAALLAKDGLDHRERIARWYSSHPNPTVSPCLDPDELAAIRALIAATFPR